MAVQRAGVSGGGEVTEAPGAVSAHDQDHAATSSTAPSRRHTFISWVANLSSVVIQHQGHQQLASTISTSKGRNPAAVPGARPPPRRSREQPAHPLVGARHAGLCRGPGDPGRRARRAAPRYHEKVPSAARPDHRAARAAGSSGQPARTGRRDQHRECQEQKFTRSGLALAGAAPLPVARRGALQDIEPLPDDRVVAVSATRKRTTFLWRPQESSTRPLRAAACTRSGEVASGSSRLLSFTSSIATIAPGAHVADAGETARPACGGAW